MPPQGQQISWGAQDVRATIFAAGDFGRLDDLYEIAFELRPQSYSEAASISPLAPSQAIGRGSLGQLVLGRSPGRFDLSMQPLPSPSFEAPPGSGPEEIQHPLIRDVSGALEQIEQAAQRFVLKCSNINRIAVAVNLSMTAPDAGGAAAILNKILPYGIVLKNESDFMLQNNIATTNKNPDALINSFSTWRISPVQQINILSNVVNGSSGPAQVISAYFLAQKIIDINTAPGLGHYDHGQARALLGVLMGRLQNLMTIS